jgi:hypothetical protein
MHPCFKCKAAFGRPAIFSRDPATEGGDLAPGSRCAELPGAPTINRILKSLNCGGVQRTAASMSMSLPTEFKENRKNLFMGK